MRKKIANRGLIASLLASTAILVQPQAVQADILDSLDVIADTCSTRTTDIGCLKTAVTGKSSGSLEVDEIEPSFYGGLFDHAFSTHKSIFNSTGAHFGVSTGRVFTEAPSSSSLSPDETALDLEVLDLIENWSASLQPGMAFMTGQPTGYGYEADEDGWCSDAFGSFKCPESRYVLNERSKTDNLFSLPYTPQRTQGLITDTFQDPFAPVQGGIYPQTMTPQSPEKPEAKSDAEKEPDPFDSEVLSSETSELPAPEPVVKEEAKVDLGNALKDLELKMPDISDAITESESEAGSVEQVAEIAAEEDIVQEDTAEEIGEVSEEEVASTDAINAADVDAIVPLGQLDVIEAIPAQDANGTGFITPLNEDDSQNNEQATDAGNSLEESFGTFRRTDKATVPVQTFAPQLRQDRGLFGFFAKRRGEDNRVVAPRQNLQSQIKTSRAEPVSPTTVPEMKKNYFYLEPLYVDRKTNSSPSSLGTDETGFGVKLGWERKGNKKSAFGLTGSATITDMSSERVNDKAEIYSGAVTSYGSYEGRRVFADLKVGGAFSRADVERTINFSDFGSTQTAEVDVLSLSATATAGLSLIDLFRKERCTDCRISDTDIRPYVKGGALWSSMREFEEETTSEFGLSLATTNGGDFFGEVGLSVDTNLRLGRVNLVPSANVAVHQNMQTEREFEASLLGYSSSGFTYDLDSYDGTNLNYGVGLNIVGQRRLGAFVRLDRSHLLGDIQNKQSVAQAGIRIHF